MVAGESRFWSRYPSPATITGRRPRRSDTGPQISVDTAIATSDSDSINCATPAGTANPVAIAGSAGDSACNETGPIAVTAANSATRGNLRVMGVG